MKKDNAQVIISQDVKPTPEEHEVSAAWILARYYNCAIIFLVRHEGYKIKTADFVMNGQMWELKSPISNSRRRCVSIRLDKAKIQSHNIIFDGRRTKLGDDFLRKQLISELEKRSSIRRLLFITKKSDIIALK